MSVTVITRNPKDGSCMACKQVKKFLTSKNVEFQEIVYDNENEEHVSLIEEIGVRSVPIVLPSGVSDPKDFFIGFDINKLRALVG